MQIIKFNNFITLILVLFLFFTQANGENKKISNGKHEINLYGGVFDFSDDKQKAGLFGIQHQNETLQRSTFLGNLSPITGGFVTENSTVYVYSGV